MADCFEKIIGLSDRDCDCFSEGRPDGDAATVAESRLSWQEQTFFCPESPANPYTLSATYKLPQDTSKKSLQLYSGGQILTVDVDFTVTGDKEVTVTTPVPGQRYELLYLATTATEIMVPDYRDSLSGLYLTDLLREEEIKGLESCDQTIWTLMHKARKIGINDFRAALSASLTQRYRVKYPTFSGFVGSDKYTERLTSDKAYAGIRIRTAGIRSGYLKIKKIMAIFSATGTVSVTIYKARVMDETGQALLEVAVPSFDINTASTPTVNNVDITLPLLSDFSDKQDYLAVFEYDASNKPWKNKVYCQPCSGHTPIPYNVTTYPGQTFEQKVGWANLFMVGGWEGNISGSQTELPATVSEYMNGLSLSVEVGCDVAASLCNLVQTFGSNPFAMSAATAVQRRAASFLGQQRLASSAPNRQNAVNRDGLATSMRRWEGEYAEIVNYLASNMPDDSSDCLVCKARVRMGEILG